MPHLVPQLEALLPKVRACLGSLQAIRHLGHVELVQATSGTLMILRHTAPLSSADRENWNAFRILKAWICISPPIVRYSKPSLVRCPGMTQTGCA